MCLLRRCTAARTLRGSDLRFEQNGLAAAGRAPRITLHVTAVTLTRAPCRWFVVASVITLRD
jgi:hypothetical protein